MLLIILVPAIARISEAETALQEESSGRNPTIPTQKYRLSLPAEWEEHKDWSLAENERTGHVGDPFGFSQCVALLNRRTKAIAQVCSGRNWLAGGSQEQIEKEFLSPMPLLADRSFLAENLMAYFFPFLDESFSKQVQDFAQRMLSGRLKEEEVRKQLLTADPEKNVFVFFVVPEPHDLRDVYASLFAPGRLVARKGEGNVTLDIDVAFLEHRLGSLGLIQGAGRKWMGFVLVTDSGLAPEFVRKFSLPPGSENRSIRFLWLIGGGVNAFSDGAALTHIVLAEPWNESPRAENLNVILAGLQLEGRAGLPSKPPSVVTVASNTLRPAVWQTSDANWTAKFEALKQPPIAEGTTEQALEQAKTAVRLAPENAEAHFRLGWFYNEMKQPDRAVPELRRVLELDPSYPQASSELAFTYEQLGDSEKATETLQAAIKVNPSDRLAHCYLGNLYQKAGREKDALDMYERALKLSSIDLCALDNAAKLLVTSKNPEVRNPQKAL
ncbi:MAG: tetratricopeptide repeat protein, partial [Acidobacteriota bacterium]|nr:tetratricopeptide repeat protein [Acidobacteriota bacterium]